MHIHLWSLDIEKAHDGHVLIKDAVVVYAPFIHYVPWALKMTLIVAGAARSVERYESLVYFRKRAGTTTSVWPAAIVEPFVST